MNNGLTEEAKQAINHTINTEGWREYIAPAFAESIELIKRQAVLRPSQRIKDFQDASADWLGGMNQGLEWALLNWQRMVDVYDANEKAKQQNGNALEGEAVGSPYGSPEGAEV